MATLTINPVVRAGLNLTTVDTAAAGGGDEFVNTGREMFYANNASGGAIVITFVTTPTVDGLAIADRTVSVPAGEIMVVGPFATSQYNDTAEKIQVTYDGVTSLTVAVIQLTAV
jgi:hypothetical protein